MRKKKVTRSKFRNQNPQFWRALWTRHLALSARYMLPNKRFFYVSEKTAYAETVTNHSTKLRRPGFVHPYSIQTQFVGFRIELRRRGGTKQSQCT
jgi:hypothetical protein